MTDEQPNALRLADRLEARCIENSPEMYAAAELRCLHAQRDQLLEALKTLLYAADDGPSYDAALVSARAAIAKAEENT